MKSPTEKIIMKIISSMEYIDSLGGKVSFIDIFY